MLVNVLLVRFKVELDVYHVHSIVCIVSRNLHVLSVRLEPICLMENVDTSAQLGPTRLILPANIAILPFVFNVHQLALVRYVTSQQVLLLAMVHVT